MGIPTNNVRLYDKDSNPVDDTHPVPTSTPSGGLVDLGAKADVAVTDPTASASVIAALKGILTDLGILTSSAVVDPAASANINALLKGIMTDIGPVAATAVTDPASSASIVAGLKGLLTLIGSLTATAVIDPTASGSVNANIKGIIKQLQGTGTGALPVSLPAGNLGQQAVSASLSINPANNITAATYIGDVRQQRSWADAVILAATNGYSGAVADLAADSAYDYTANVDLATLGYTGMHATLEYDSSGTTDNIVLSVFGSLDGTNFDDTELYSITCTATSGADTQMSINLSACPPHLRFGVKTTGTTNTFDYKITYRAFK